MKIFVLKSRYDDGWCFEKIREPDYYTRNDYMKLHIGLNFRVVR